MTFAWRPGVAARCLRDVWCRQRTDKRLSRAIWSSFNKERMSHLCDSTVAGPTARRDNVLASKCEYPPFRYPPFKCALKAHAEWHNVQQTDVNNFLQKSRKKSCNSLGPRQWKIQQQNDNQQESAKICRQFLFVPISTCLSDPVASLRERIFHTFHF